jgi:hypothetical protein
MGKLIVQSVEWLKSYSMGYGNSPVAPLKRNSENFRSSHVSSLVELN